MKDKIKYSLEIIVTAFICYYSAYHTEKYHIFIPILFGILSALGISLLIDELKSGKKND